MNNYHQIRSAKKEDIPAIFDLIKALAEYEQLSESVTGNRELLKKHLFDEPNFAEAIVAELGDKIIGFALFFANYSTFLTQPGIYLEDLFILPEYRGQGIGKEMLSYLARLAIKRGCGRLEWTVLNWNESAIKFYEKMGAKVLPDWKICRLTGEYLLKFE
jgi:GNAT superfamily N-acetyltransferase